MVERKEKNSRFLLVQIFGHRCFALLSQQFQEVLSNENQRSKPIKIEIFFLCARPKLSHEYRVTDLFFTKAGFQIDSNIFALSTNQMTALSLRANQRVS